MSLRLLTLGAVFHVLVSVNAWGQEFGADDYHAYLAAPGRPTEQTPASERLRLFSGHEQAPTSQTLGVSLQRERRLRALAARFSPILVPTNFSVPRDVEDMFALTYVPADRKVYCRRSFELMMDVWKTTGSSSVRDPDSSRQVPLKTLRSPESCGVLDTLGTAQRPTDSLFWWAADTTLWRLLLNLGPKAEADSSHKFAKAKGYTLDRRVRQNADTVLYFDMPGSEQASWRDAHSQLRHLRSRIYVHPFVYEHESARSTSRYELVFQYWFFYPFNDGVNNHEGDWEHVNVSVSARDRMVNQVGEARLLTESDVREILEGEGAEGLEDLVISAVDYYFHGFVVTLDYKGVFEEGKATTADMYTKEMAERFGLVRGRVSPDENQFYSGAITKLIDDRMKKGETLLETHPVSFIGGKSVSPLQIAWVPGPRNENSHGSFPFAGVWRGVGPLMAREKMRGDIDAGTVVKLEQELDTVPPGLDTLGIVHYIDSCWLEGGAECGRIDSSAMVLLPDWEQIIEPLYIEPNVEPKNAALRRQWGWFVLPVRWGFPTTGSPGARLIRGYDFGHTAPIGPAFNPGWNRVGSGPSYARYPLFPLTRGLQQTPWDNIFNVLGFGNSVTTTATLLPPLSVAATLVTGIMGRRVYQPTRPGMRNVDVGFAGSWGYGGTGFARRLPRIATFTETQPGAAPPVGQHQDFTRDPDFGKRLELILHWGRRWGTETIYGWRTSSLFYHGHLDNGSFADVHGDLRKDELLGVFRFGTLVPMGFQGQFVLRFGYGWTWYKIDNIRLQNQGGPPFATTTAPDMREGPHILPNTLLGGAAFESNFRLFQRPKSTFGFRLAATAYATDDVGGRTDFTLGAMLGF